MLVQCPAGGLFRGVLFGSRGGSQILYGLGIVLIVLFMPDGLIQIFLKRRKKNKELAHAE